MILTRRIDRKGTEISHKIRLILIESEICDWQSDIKSLLQRSCRCFPEPEKKCHTCRRRRVKCDFSTPTCRKCSESDVECLGYGSCILWVPGVASRGKMTGKSFYEIPSSFSARPFEINARQRHFNISVTRKPTTVLCRALFDPCFQGLDADSRYYISHFLTYAIHDLVIHSSASQFRNPIHSLLESSGIGSALYHAIIAISAHHLCNLSARSVQAEKFRIDTFSHKGQALEILRKEISPIDLSNCTSLLASTMFLSYLELLESEDGIWHLHLEAATRLAGLMKASFSEITLRMTGDETFLCAWTVSRVIM